MKNKASKFLALFMVVAIVFSLGACGKDNDKEKETTTSAGETTMPASETVTQEETPLVSESTTDDETTLESETTAVGETTTAAVNVIPTTKAEILAAYTAVMNKAKADKPGFKRYEYQALPDGVDNRKIEKGPNAIISPLLNLVNNNFLTTKEKALSDAEVFAKGGDMKMFPVRDANKGCLLTDVNAIKTASCVKQTDGNYKLKITLKDEMNPAHYRSGNTAPSKTGGIFMPLDKDDVDPELNKGFVQAVVKNAEYSMAYYNCTVTLVYNPLTQRVVSVDQVLYNKITMSGTVLGISGSGWQVLIMNYNITDLVY